MRSLLGLDDYGDADDAVDISRRRPAKRRKRTHDDLSDDLGFHISGRQQWREALLYNIGAARIPQGPQSTESFRLVWQQAIGMRRRNRR